MPLPGDLLSVGELRIGQLVAWHDGKWCPAKVFSMDGEGADAAATLKFISYGPGTRPSQTYKEQSV